MNVRDLIDEEIIYLNYCVSKLNDAESVLRTTQAPNDTYSKCKDLASKINSCIKEVRYLLSDAPLYDGKIADLIYLNRVAEYENSRQIWRGY